MKFAIVFASIVTLGLAGAAQAMPVAPVHTDSLITQVAQGCGPGMARNAAGRCRPSYMLRKCEFGKHRNWAGRCVFDRR